MSRSEEVNKVTESIYKGILDQFNPGLKHFVAMGKHYERSLTGVMVAAKGYFDAMVKLGELASDSQGSKELGNTLFQMAEIHRQIQVELEEVLNVFHSELISQLEQKLDLDNKFLTASLKKYQAERKTRTDSIEHCQTQLKKLRRKSQASRHPNKYSDREMQFVELMSRHQGELDALVAVAFRSALTEERRRYCFLVDRHCAATKLFINYHGKVRELLSQKLCSWQQSCSQPTRLPERALNILRHTAPQCAGAAGIAELLRQAKLGAGQPLEQRLSVQEVQPLLNGDPNPRTQRAPPSSQSASASKAHTPVTQESYSSPPPSHNPLLLKAAELYVTSTLPLSRRTVSESRMAFLGGTLPRVLPVAPPTRVEALFPHVPGGGEGGGAGGTCLLHFLPGDTLTLLISEPKDGWHYGQNERTGRKGWFPISYTQTCAMSPEPLGNSSPLLSKGNSASTSYLDKMTCPGAQHLSAETGEGCSAPPSRVNTFRRRPNSLASPDTTQCPQLTAGGSSPPSSPNRTNPFGHIRLRKAVTNDRSAPLIQ
ncbi:brain-specific angiogenesis inhibitor 1-associated protein 2-like [Megalops cyprinoides]|uniref:brain-specific angiogenesis inhibitor 1-associated protein 2-like n=1 Tax=Megalops cyprinoides TaxID=118141 RepID=UPI0018642448|nr:brain-specific angiogenesis inhibitor 1-associated protein 2-like [Megalops cyprinoides]